MDDNTTLIQLEELAARLGIKVRYEPLATDATAHMGGFCRIRGEEVIIVNRKAKPKEKIHVLIDALKRRDLSGIYLLPSLRTLLEKTDDQ